MERAGEVDQGTKKLSDIIDRSADLLTSNKHYEFAQKIKMLAQRKIQTNKHSEAEILLRLGIRKMIFQEVPDFNAIHDLVIALLELYEANRTLWKENTARK